MSSTANLPDLIISLSRDKVFLNLSALPEQGRDPLKTSFEVDGLFLEEQISAAFDQLLLANPVLIDHFPCVEIILIDRPNVNIPLHYIENAEAAEIASNYLRLRIGDSLSTDPASSDSVLCYTMPSDTMQMFKEYYVNCRLTHISSILLQALKGYENEIEKQSITFFTVVNDILIVLATRNGKLIFSKNFNIRTEADLFYYAIACSRMLKSESHWMISIENEETSYDMPGESILKIDQRISFPSLHVLISRYKQCES